jgi:hypothetical protein
MAFPYVAPLQTLWNYVLSFISQQTGATLQSGTAPWQDGGTQVVFGWRWKMRHMLCRQQFSQQVETEVSSGFFSGLCDMICDIKVAWQNNLTSVNTAFPSQKPISDQIWFTSIYASFTSECRTNHTRCGILKKSTERKYNSGCGFSTVCHSQWHPFVNQNATMKSGGKEHGYGGQ